MTKPHLLLVLIAASFLVGGLVEPFFPHAGQPFNGVSTVQNIIVAILGFAWCKAHASSRRITAPSGSGLFVALFAPIGVPVYFFRSMPWRTVSIATLKAIAYFVVLVALLEAGFYLGKFAALDAPHPTSALTHLLG